MKTRRSTAAWRTAVCQAETALTKSELYPGVLIRLAEIADWGPVPVNPFLDGALITAGFVRPDPDAPHSVRLTDLGLWWDRFTEARRGLVQRDRA